uniref:Uncharacterized protein n=1 Tax=Arundo donax TaxID=35708 RepID=A0A0A9HSA8_ARUDO
MAQERWAPFGGKISRGSMCYIEELQDVTLEKVTQSYFGRTYGEIASCQLSTLLCMHMQKTQECQSRR